MKKVIWILILLLLIAGVAVYYGYVITPYGTFVVCDTKSSGVLPAIHWRDSHLNHLIWQNLIPHNIHCVVYPDGEQQTEVSIHYPLVPGLDEPAFQTALIQSATNLAVDMKITVDYYFDDIHALSILKRTTADEVVEILQNAINRNVKRELRDNAVQYFSLQFKNLPHYVETVLHPEIRSIISNNGMIILSMKLTDIRFPYGISWYDIEAFNKEWAHDMQQVSREYSVAYIRTKRAYENWGIVGPMLKEYPQLMYYLYLQSIEGKQQIQAYPPSPTIPFQPLPLTHP